MPASRIAASTRTRPLIEGPIRAGRVLGAFPRAVYVEVDVDVGAELVAVETADGLGLPRAATLATPSSLRPLRGIRAGDAVHIGEGRLDIGPLTFDVVRWWSPRRPRAGTAPHDDARLAAVARLLPDLPSELTDRLRCLTSALATSPAADLQDAVTALLGLGAGLTPQGDDVLAGLLVTLAARPATQLHAQRLGDIVAREAGSRTTTLSAALLRDAADGFAVPALVDLVDALYEGERTGRTTTHQSLADVVVRLLAVGHTSGAALAHGAVAAARQHSATQDQPEVA